jgi:hypothetical protein
MLRKPHKFAKVLQQGRQKSTVSYAEVHKRQLQLMSLCIVSKRGYCYSGHCPDFFLGGGGGRPKKLKNLYFRLDPEHKFTGLLPYTNTIIGHTVA